MANFTAGTSFSDGVTNDVTAAKLNALVADAVPTSNLSLNSTTGTIATFNSTTPTFLGAITASTNTINVGSGQIYKDATGNVGVGTSSPAAKLDVVGTGKFSDVLTVKSTSATPSIWSGLYGGAISILGDNVTSNRYIDLSIIDSGGNLATQGLRVTNSGNVGVGTASPAGKLHVNGQTYIQGTVSGGLANSTLIANSSGQAQIWGLGPDASTVGSMTFIVGRSDLSSSNQAITIDSSGNVGVGTAVPAAKLHVASGNMRLDDNQYILWGGTTNGINGNNASNLLGFYTNSTERLRIDSSGSVGIGTASPASKLHVVGASGLTLSGTDSAVRIARLDSAIEGSNGARFLINVANDSGTLIERLRIDSSGNLLVGTTDAGTTTGVGLKFIASATVPLMAYVIDTTSNTSNYHLYNTNATNNGYRFFVTANGGVSNFSANNSNLSDERLKTNINLAGNYLDKICSIPVKTFNYKDQGEDTEKTIGVLAQEVEAHIPELVNNDGFGETPADGIPLKTIYQTDLQYVLMRCIQELSAKVTALEAA